MASKNLVLKGATWNGVESVDFNVSGGGTARFVETSDADATAADIANGKTAYVNGSLITGSATAPVLTTKSITQNGTYNASSDSADGYSSVTVNVSGGGGGDPWSWMGKNPTKVQTYTTIHKKFSETDFNTWTWGTSAATILASSDYSQTVSLNPASYDYLQIVKLHVHYDYGTWTPKAAMLDYALSGNVIIRSGYNSASAATSETKNTCSYTETLAVYQSYYANSSGTKYLGQTPYGLYATGVSTPSVTGTYPSMTATFKTPVLYARGQSSYFSETAFNNLDKDESYFDLTCEIWRVDAGTSDRDYMYTDTVHILNNGV